MYPTTNDYQAAVQENVQRWRIRGAVGSNDRLVEWGEYILNGSLEFNNQASDATDIVLGARYIGELELTFTREFAYNYYGRWIGQVIYLEIGIDTNQWGTNTEWVPLTPYTVTEAEWDVQSCHIKAVDNMAKFDKPATFTGTSGTLYDVLSFLCNRAGVGLGMTQNQCREFPNGTRTLTCDPRGQGSLKTYRDILSWLAQAAASFATIDRNGDLVLRRFTKDTDDFMCSDLERYMGGTWSDFETKYTGISVTNLGDNTTSYYHAETDDGLTMNLGGNPFLQLGLQQDIRAMREEILEEVEQIRWTPFDVTMIPDVSIDLGDRVDFRHTPGHGSWPKGIVMGITYKFGSGIEIEGFGKNPALATVQSKNEKQIAGILSDMNNQVVRYFVYENSGTIGLTEVPTQAALIAFGNSQETDVDIWHEFKYTATLTDPTMKIYALYYLDGVLQDYQPIDTISEDGEHVLGLHFHIPNLNTDSYHSWKVMLKTVGGTASIAAGDGHVVLSGVDLGAGSEWDGVIRVDDQVPLYALNGVCTVPIADAVTFSELTPIRLTPNGDPFTDNVPTRSLNGVKLVSVTDQMYLECLSPEWYQHTNEGLYASTSDHLTTALI